MRATQQTLSQVSIEYCGLNLVALGVTYMPGLPATLRDPAEQDEAKWDLLYLWGDPGKHDLTRFLNYSHLENIEEVICEKFRE